MPAAVSVVVGRSLDETQQRIAQFGNLIAMAWMAIVAGLLVLVGMAHRWP